MSQATAYEQLMLELVNRERAKTGAQPLAFNGNLNDSADQHSNWMIATDVFNHTGLGGSSPHQRMINAGYSFTGSWTSGENIAWASLRGPAGLQDEVELLHANLMKSPGHKANILNGSFQEIGIGFQTGGYQTWDAAFVTQNFARSGSKVFLTGVTMDDKDGDRFYDIGEGLGSLTVTAVSATGAKYTTTTGSAGGYNLALDSGTYKVTFSGGGYSSVTKQVSVGSSNVKLDLIDPARGTSGNNTIYGTAAANTIKGLGGNDTLYGRAGNDKLYGGTGRDFLAGESGNDLLSGGTGADTFRFTGKWGADKITDFTNGVDRIDLRGNDLSFRELSITRGNGDSDGKVDDVIVKADGQSIALLNVKLSLIGASDFLF
ncbi:Ca2+-binding RTX toxin-like protein [Microvirga lupini]|uniref:Ca2+-binding RTX toxin-like protein n=1 Tax=Microvirga lupini TaxID=420324 RepID=A0A7W4YWG4_9HYPH|nr:CAP domain-containing protein [Microvirga lupini]MBB3017963.1 Ca2+-binding RTX toxin-like protein [Microvirga lupini]